LGVTFAREYLLVNNKSRNTRFLQTIGAYSCAVFLGAYLSSAYSHIAAKAVFMAIPVLTLTVARIRTRLNHQVLQFERESAVESAAVKAEDNFETFSRHFDLVNQAS
jgi:TPP-dependent trihydroxycyclohexane-1,2-dione (THcHDO) dehydratase